MRAFPSSRAIRTVLGAVMAAVSCYGLVSDGLDLAGVVGSKWLWALLVAGVALITADLWLPAAAHRAARVRASEEHAALRLSQEQARAAFAAELEDLVRDGFRVQEFIESGPIPMDGKPSERAVERTNEFRARCVALLREDAPTLLGPFAKAGNAYRRENSGTNTTQDIREALAGMAWHALLLDVQANMRGLEAVQEELGRPFGGQRA